MSRSFRTAILGIACALAISPLQAQQLLDRYTAVIGPPDRSNSSGVPLSQPAQILAQDRANVHRYGIRQAGDAIDSTFATPAARGQIGALLARGTMGPGVAQALLGGGMTRLDIQVLGTNGRPESLYVTLADTAAPQPQQSTGGSPVSTNQIQWNYATGAVDGVTVASMDLQRDGALLATLRCMTSAAPGPVLGVDPRAGVITIQFSPALTGPQVDGGRAAELYFGSQPRLRQWLSFDPVVKVYAMHRTLTQHLRDDLDRGARFSLITPQAGQIDARVPQDVGRAFSAACGARGVDAAVSPGFDCARAGASTEHAICSVPALGALDARLNAAYAGAPEPLKASQRAWIGARDGCGADVDCIVRMTEERIVMLTGGGAAVAATAGANGAVPNLAVPGGAARALAAPEFAQMPASAPPPAGGEILVGNQAVLDRFLLWTLGQNPELAADRSVQWRLQSYDFPPNLPEADPRDTSGVKARARLEAAASLFADRPPRRVVLEQPMTIQRSTSDPDDPLVLNGGFTTRIGDTPAIVQIAIQDRGAGATGGLRLDLAKPFYMPVPENFLPLPPGMVQSNRGQTLALIDMTLADPVPELRSQRYMGGSAQATVHSVTFVYRPKNRENGRFTDGPDQVLHVWSGGQGESVEVFRPGDPTSIAALYGGGVSNGRYVLNTYQMPDGFGEAAQPQLQGSSPADLLMTAMTLSAITATQPDRTLDPDLAQTVMRSLLTERERVDLFPLNIATQIHNDRPTELELQTAFARNDQILRDRVGARAPALPLSLRFTQQVGLGEYDFASGGFPVHWSSQPGPWMPLDTQGRPVTQAMPDLLPIAPDAAQALLDRLARGASGNPRALVLVVDYTLVTLTPRPGRVGPISARELGSVQPSFTVLSMGLYSTTDPKQPVFDIVLPDTAGADRPIAAQPPVDTPFTTAGGLPDTLFLTTGRSLLGAVDVLDDTGKTIDDALLSAYRVLPQQPQSTYEMRKAALRAEMRALARESYWIGASIELKPFDAERGGFPISNVNFVPVGHAEDFGGIEPPAVTPAEPEDYSLLRVPEGAVPLLGELLGDRRYVTAYLKVTPLGAVYDRRNGGALVISAPTEAIFGDDSGSAMPRRADLWLRIAAPERIGTALGGGEGPTEVAAPDALMLDPEGLDLLALSLAPEAFDDAMFRRMLVDRLLKERSVPVDAKAQASADSIGATLTWRRFFANPDLSLRADAAEALLPEFKAWTLARAAALPTEVLLPIGNENPQSACRGLQQISTPQLEASKPYYAADLPALLGPGQSLPAEGRNLYSSRRPTPGPDRVWYWDGGGKSGGGMACRHVKQGLSAIDRGLRPDTAGHISAMVVVKAQPDLRRVAEVPDSFTYRLSIEDLRFVPAAALSAPSDGLAGMLVMKTEVQGAVGYRSGRFGSGAKTVASIKKGDWDPLIATPPAAEDILGFTLEMPRDAFVNAIRDRKPDAAFYKTDVPGKGLFGHAVAVHDPHTGESIVGIYADHAPDKPIMAIMRRLELDASAVSIDALKTSLKEKYGEAFRESGPNQWFWGALPQEEDNWGFCGGPSILRLENQADVPAMTTQDADLFGDKAPISGNHYWGELGWPSEFRDQSGAVLPDIAQCGPLVAVYAIENGGRLIAATWLFDRRVSRKLDAVPRDEPTKAKIQIEF